MSQSVSPSFRHHMLLKVIHTIAYRASSECLKIYIILFCTVPPIQYHKDVLEPEHDVIQLISIRLASLSQCEGSPFGLEQNEQGRAGIH